MVKLKTLEKPFGTLNDFKIHLGLPIHVGIVTEPSSFVVLSKHSINMFQLSKGLVRLKSANFIDCILFAIDKVEEKKVSPISQLGRLSRSVVKGTRMSAKSSQGMPLSAVGVAYHIHHPHSFLCSCRPPLHLRSMKKLSYAALGLQALLWVFKDHSKKSCWHRAMHAQNATVKA